MRDLTAIALNTAKRHGASYADVRILQTTVEDLTVRNGELGEMRQDESLGLGVRVIADGAWGFAAGPSLAKEDIRKTAVLACRIAKASAKLKKGNVRLSKEDVVDTAWQTPLVIDPFKVPVSEKLDLLFRIDEILRKDRRIKVAESTMGCVRERQWLATSEGTFVDQTLTRTGAGYAATAVENGEVQKRSYPMSFGGQYMGMGYELVRGLALIENAEKTREEAVALLTAKPCPPGKKDLILDGTQLALQIHESMGHPSELDRVLGLEENYAGRSFLTMEKYKKFRYGSERVTLMADSTVPGGLSTFGYDDDGVRAQRWPIVQNGIFVGYHTNREFAPVIREPSRGCGRADSWASLPMIRITNLSLMPGDRTLDELIADTKDGIFMCTNKSWSIDQMRYNFQFGCEIGWEIRKGRRGAMLKNCTYQGITPEFWGSCDAVCDGDHWTLWGVVNCGKGQPGQTAEMSHGAAPARFRKVTVGVTA
ncbi:MAG TPA: TldD/PmbA family protein [Nitrospiria bacterium]|nr:TldD/PmbA family protein [Nitrospiria bacterium]